MSAIAGSRLAAVRSVPDTGSRRPSGSACTPSERGKNSYHAPNSARCRCTMISNRPDRLRRSRSG